MSVIRSNHCTYDTHYHIVFPVKYRKALLTHAVTKAIREIAADISERYDIEFEQLGTDLNHIHILCSFHPKLSGGDVVRIFKSITAKQLFQRFPELKKDLWGGEFWTDGYYIATVSKRADWTTVERYVANQEKTMGKPTQLSIL